MAIKPQTRRRRLANGHRYLCPERGPLSLRTGAGGNLGGQLFHTGGSALHGSRGNDFLSAAIQFGDRRIVSIELWIWLQSFSSLRHPRPDRVRAISLV